MRFRRVDGRDVAVGAALVAVVALGWWLLAERGGTSSPDETGSRRLPEPAPPPPSLSAVPSPVVAGPPAPTPVAPLATTVDAAPAGGVVVHGTARYADGRPVLGGVVHVCDSGNGSAWKGFIADGLYRVETSLPIDGPATRVSLAAAVPGHASRWAAVVPRGEAVLELPLVLRGGEPWTGVVVDPQGGPVAGLEVAVEPVGGRHQSSWLEPKDVVVLHKTALDGGGRATTDADGRLEIRGLDPGPHLAFAVSVRWFLDEAVDVLPGSQARLVARPALGLHAKVVDAETGVALPRFGGHLDMGDTAVGVGGETGRIAGWFPRPTGDDAPAEVRLVLHAVGYEPLDFPVAYAAGERHRTVDVRLRRLREEDLATVVFDVAGAEPSFCERGFHLTLRVGSDAGPSILRVDAVRMDDTRFAVRAPPGLWFGRLQPDGGWCNFVAWEGELALGPGQRASVRWEVPPYGHVRLDAREASAKEPLADVLVSHDGRSWSAVPVRLVQHLPLPTLPAGDWRVELRSREGPLRLARDTFRVRPGEETAFELDLADEPDR